MSTARRPIACGCTGSDAAPQDRALYARSKPCAFACRFCFSEFASYTPNAHFTAETTPKGTILYPSCDGEFFTDQSAVRALDAVLETPGSPILVSISTRAPITTRLAREIAHWNLILRSGRGGFVKVSLSASSKFSLTRDEPFAANYQSRIDSLQELSSVGVPSSLNLKPLLPDIEIGEYAEIVGDAAPFVSRFLLGGLYLDPTKGFGRAMIERYGSITKARVVDWLPNRPIWPYIEDTHKTEVLTRIIVASDCRPFMSDMDVMSDLAATLL